MTRFRVYVRRLDAHFGLAFATATPNGLTSPPTITRRPIMQKVRSRTLPEGHSASTACRHTVSGSFHSPSRGSFRLSLMVLVHYRSSGSIYPLKMVLPDSHRVARAPWYSGTR